MKRGLYLFISILLFAALISGCSSLKYVKNARTSFDNVKAAGAENTAPFEYYAAEAYLEFADHELEEGDHPQAKIFAEESEKYTAQAIEMPAGGAK